MIKIVLEIRISIPYKKNIFFYIMEVEDSHIILRKVVCI